MSARRAATDLAVLLLALSACWPLTELLQGSALGKPAFTLVALVWAVGALCRLRSSRPATTVGLQLAALVAGTVGVYLSHGGALSVTSIQETLSSAREVADASVAPLPSILGLLTMLAFGAGLIALVVDYVAGSAELPLLAALPVAAPFILTTTALGETLAVRYFVAAAVAWALLVLVTTLTFDRNVLRSTLSTLPIFAVMTAIAIVAALAFSPSVPHRATPALAEGGARGVDNTVDFMETLDLSKSLKSRNGAPVLTYETSAPSPAPLRVTTSSTYRDGQWKAQNDGPFTTARTNSELPDPGADGGAPARTWRMSVTLNGMRPPLVAAPTPLQAVNFGKDNPSFRFGTNTGVPYLSKPANAYSLIYREYTGKARPSSNEKVGIGASLTQDDLDTSSLPEAARPRVASLTEAAGAQGASTPFESAVALQRYLRTDPSFRYSLTLAPTRNVDGRPLDPLSNFLDTRQGYCTQYATAMVMSARSLGIPARLAIGFLPGTERSKTFEVRAADAHAWAELYFPGLGWTRFDPTPGTRSGAPPPYAPDTPAASATPSSAPSSSTSVAPKPSVAKPSTSTTTSTSTSTTKPANPEQASFPWRVVLLSLGGAALLAALVSLLPLAGRRHRGALLRAAQDERARDEGAWHAMLWSLRDLGYVMREGRSPRATIEAFTRDNPQAGAVVRDALERACTGMESSRYAPSPGRSQASACERVVRAAREDSSLRARLVALVAPTSGRAHLRELLARVRR